MKTQLYPNYCNIFLRNSSAGLSTWFNDDGMWGWSCYLCGALEFLPIGEIRQPYAASRNPTDISIGFYLCKTWVGDKQPKEH